MKSPLLHRFFSKALMTAAALFLIPAVAVAMHGNAVIPGVTGPTFNLSARSSHISTADGNSLYVWGYANGLGTVQYPGPTLIVNQDDIVTITLVNHLPQATSIVVPGFEVTATGGVPGLLTREAPPDRITQTTYTFTADRPGTFSYYSGTNADLQIEMGLIGGLIVRPSGFNQDIAEQRTAYGDARSAYDHEYLFLTTEMDIETHDLAEQGRFDEIDTTAYWPVYWFLNGRNAPDTMAAANVDWLPAQPYNCMPMMNAGQRMLLRMIGGGRDPHPFHTHGNNFDLIARDGYLLAISTTERGAEVGVIPDLSISDFGQTVSPGATYDAVFTWTGKGLGWDFYGHTSSDEGTLAPGECPGGIGDPLCDHGKPFPVILPDSKELTFGAFYSGSPFLGAAGSLPPGEGGNNPGAGFVYMWHSHNEKEMTNNDIFPGGLMTMLIIEAPDMIMALP